jgi:5-formyltetrahydrofolate cyclo-ligase
MKMAEKKKHWRQWGKEKRNTLSPPQIKEKSEIIKEKLFSLPTYQASKVIMFYVSFSSEVSTHQMIKESLLKGKEVVVPLCLKAQKELLLFKIESFEELKKGAYGILEPDDLCYFILPTEVELLVVPGIVFDRAGYRIGYGGGYFDRLLSRVKKEAEVIGLAFHLQVVEKIPHTKYDQPVKKIITEKEIIRRDRDGPKKNSSIRIS